MMQVRSNTRYHSRPREGDTARARPLRTPCWGGDGDERQTLAAVERGRREVEAVGDEGSERASRPACEVLERFSKEEEPTCTGRGSGECDGAPLRTELLLLLLILLLFCCDATEATLR